MNQIRIKKPRGKEIMSPTFKLILLVFLFFLLQECSGFVKKMSSYSRKAMSRSKGSYLTDDISRESRKSSKRSRNSPRSLGPSSLISPLNLKRRRNQPKDYHIQESKVLKVEVLEELECVQTMFMSPFHFPVHFSVNRSIYGRIEKKCRMSFIGTEPCIPKLTCDTSKMKSCEHEYMEIVDGHKGYKKVCSGDQVENVTATGDLRDLFIHYTVTKLPKGWKKKKNKTLVSCTVSCGKRGEGTPLPTEFFAKVNPKCYCGTKPNEDRIVGGENAKKFEFPWLVALVETNTRQPFCGGSIINDKFILTAGHCIKGKYVDYRNVQIVVNGHEFDSSPNSNIQVNNSAARTYPYEDLLKMDKGNGSTRYNIDEIMVHPLYVSENNDFDIALLKLQSKLDLSARPTQVGTSPLQQPRAICLPPMGSYLRTYSNKKAMIAGWGLPAVDAEGTPQILQKLEVNVFSPAKCKGFFAHRVNRRMMCAGHAEGGKDSCSGDSGGPLVLEDKPKVWTQIGSVSWGDGCGEEGYPGVYFRTTEGVQWISYVANYYEGEDPDDKGATWCIVP